MSGKYSTGWQPWDSESAWDCYSCANLNNCDHACSYTCSRWTDTPTNSISLGCKIDKDDLDDKEYRPCMFTLKCVGWMCDKFSTDCKWKARYRR